MTQPTSSRLSEMTRPQLLILLADRMEAADAAERVAKAANEAVEEVFRHLSTPMPPGIKLGGE